MLTLQQWLNQTTLPRNEARMLLQQITGYTRAQLITHDTEILSATQLTALNQLAQRRTQGEPMAYILGEREFYGRTFRVSPAVLIPRPETEHLLEAALFRLPTHGILWDMGTGSGIIAITAALERSDATVYASDISHDALAIAQQNATTLGANVQFAQGSWFAAAHAFRQPVDKVHVLVSNPPYIENHDPHLTQGDLRFEPQTALTDFADGLQHIREIARHAPNYLHENGYLLLEHGYDQATVVQHILRENGFVDVQTLPDLAGLDRVTLGQITT